jgi:hypothetical protein
MTALYYIIFILAFCTVSAIVADLIELFCWRWL